MSFLHDSGRHKENKPGEAGRQTLCKKKQMDRKKTTKEERSHDTAFGFSRDSSRDVRDASRGRQWVCCCQKGVCAVACLSF